MIQKNKYQEALDFLWEKEENGNPDMQWALETIQFLVYKEIFPNNTHVRVVETSGKHGAPVGMTGKVVYTDPRGWIVAANDRESEDGVSMFAFDQKTVKVEIID